MRFQCTEREREMHTHYINITSTCTSSIYTVLIFQVKVEIAKLREVKITSIISQWMEAANDLLHAKSGSSKNPYFKTNYVNNPYLYLVASLSVFHCC